jgi:hypothetical protein
MANLLCEFVRLLYNSTGYQRFVGNSPYDFSGGGWNHFDFKTELSLDRIFQCSPELGAGRNVKNDFAGLFGCFLSLRPFGLPGGLGKR